eukprot:jgi/Tetstr1/420708/TSEL_011792.t1
MASCGCVRLRGAPSLAASLGRPRASTASPPPPRGAPLSPGHCWRRRGAVAARAMSTEEKKRSSRVEPSVPEQPSGGPDPPQTAPDAEGDDDGLSSKLIAGGGVFGGLVLVGAAATIFKDDIRSGLDYFTTIVDDWGALGYAAYMLLYTLLEVLAVPAIPLTMTAGVLFGSLAGTAMVSVSATAAATIAFLISRYLARDKVLAWAQGKKKFQAIDRAIGEEGLKVVILLRLSPLLPLAASNYLYGLTSVSLADYALGSWLGMLPGTVAYVSFGEVSKNVINGQDSAPGFSWWQGGIALGATLLAITYVGSIASQALTDIEATMDDQ